MKLKPKQKIYVSVLGVCAMALMFDKTILGPSDASAQPPAVPVVALAVDRSLDLQVDMTDGFDPDDSARANIANRLASVASRRGLGSDAVADAFRPAVSWYPEEQVVVRPMVDAGSAGDRFRQAHQLNAVMAGSRSFALVDGRTLLVGQKMDGFTLISVSETGAMFESDRGRVELTLPVVDR
jgi:hypothetical protein